MNSTERRPIIPLEDDAELPNRSCGREGGGQKQNQLLIDCVFALIFFVSIFAVGSLVRMSRQGLSVTNFKYININNTCKHYLHPIYHMEIPALKGQFSQSCFCKREETQRPLNSRVKNESRKVLILIIDVTNLKLKNKRIDQERRYKY